MQCNSTRQAVYSPLQLPGPTQLPIPSGSLGPVLAWKMYVYMSLLSVQYNSWHWTDIKSFESMSVCLCVCLSVCPHKRFVHDSDHNFCPIFLRFGTGVRHVIRKIKFDGQVPRVNGRHFRPQNRFLGENL